ncbi:unnamed protein product [Notodromas monacha]|uniref:L27 domain-containing protein n=1 Tax=Notodromas monacha TaxID=399045 RepID=A0A7R9BY34_9CRUS|nr:unnamed protein product [Notodromas monacha]CAG0922547.1 unnamed protein product [Notodromas monacha]
MKILEQEVLGVRRGFQHVTNPSFVRFLWTDTRKFAGFLGYGNPVNTSPAGWERLLDGDFSHMAAPVREKVCSGEANSRPKDSGAPAREKASSQMVATSRPALTTEASMRVISDIDTAILRDFKMPVRKQEAHRALELLEDYHSKLVRNEDKQLRLAIERVIRIFKSRLFQALLGLTLCVLVCAILGHGVFCAPVAVADNDGGDGGNERSGGVIVPGDAPWDRDAFAPGMGRWTTLGKGILQLQVPCLSFPFLGSSGLTLCVLVCAILGHGVFCAPVAVADNDGGDGGNERSGGVIVPGDAPWDRDAFAPGMGRWTTLGKGILQLQELARQFKIPSAIFDENEIMRRRQIHGFVDGLPKEADEAESFSDDFSQPHFESERNTESLGVNLSPVRYEFAEQEQDDALETVAAEKMDLHYLYTHGLNTEPLVKGDDGDPVSRDLQINARLSSGQQQGYSAGNGPDKDSNYCWTRFLP